MGQIYKLKESIKDRTIITIRRIIAFFIKNILSKLRYFAKKKNSFKNIIT